MHHHRQPTMSEAAPKTSPLKHRSDDHSPRPTSPGGAQPALPDLPLTAHELVVDAKNGSRPPRERTYCLRLRRSRPRRMTIAVRAAATKTRAANSRHQSNGNAVSTFMFTTIRGAPIFRPGFYAHTALRAPARSSAWRAASRARICAVSADRTDRAYMRSCERVLDAPGHQLMPRASEILASYHEDR